MNIKLAIILFLIPLLTNCAMETEEPSGLEEGTIESAITAEQDGDFQFSALQPGKGPEAHLEEDLAADESPAFFGAEPDARCVLCAALVGNAIVACSAAGRTACNMTCVNRCSLTGFTGITFSCC